MSQQSARGESSETDQFFAACLAAKNQGEVEIGKFASERAQNQQVKQFAQMMVTDHQALLPKLQQLAGNQSSSERSSSIQRTSSEGQSGLSSQSGQADQQSATSGGLGQQAGGSGVTGQPGRQAQTSGSSQFGEPGGSQQAAQSGQAGTSGISGQSGQSSQLGQSSTQSSIASRMGGDSNAIQQLIAIDRQIAENCTRNLREKLQEKQGAEFDMAYIGSQIAMHNEMLSSLEVLKNQTSGQLRQVVQEAEPKVKQHLQHAEQIAEQLKGSSGRQTEAASRPGETPRVPR